MAYCSSCGTLLYTNDARFCAQCGTSLTQQSGAITPEPESTYKSPSAEQVHYDQRQKSVARGVAIAVGIVILFGAIAAINGYNSSDNSTSERNKVTYTVTGTDASMIAGLTYQNESGGSEQKTVLLPWTLEFTARNHAFLYVSAQKQGENGTIRASINVDGDVIQKAEANSSYGIATVSGRAP